MNNIKKTVVAVCFFVLWSFNQHVFAQAKILSETEINQLFDTQAKTKLGIEYKIFRTYQYEDKKGKTYLLLTEKSDKTIKEDVLSSKIKAFCFTETANGLEKQWEINDFTIKQVNGGDEEKGMWFWTKYASVEDLDKDGLVDPILVYGTKGMNNYDDGRIKILIFSKGKKIGIRHQNGVLDGERNTQVDADFYSLSKEIQNKVKSTMETIAKNNQAIFPNGWQEAMQQQKQKIAE